MNKILHDLSEPSLIHAIEANSREFLLTLGRLGGGEERNEPEIQIYHKIGWNDAVPWRHYLGRWRGEPVATTSLFLGAGVAEIYFVFTLPAAPRQGFGAAITLAALHDARQLGYRIGVLGSSPMGYPVYQHLGFQEYCHMWNP